MSTLDSVLLDSLKPFLLNWGPIAWRDQVSAPPPRPDGAVSRMLGALASIEDDAFYMQVKIRYTGAGRYTSLREFNAIWLAEESEHARALAALALRFGATDQPRRRPHAIWYRDRQSLLMRPLLWARGLYPPGLLASYLTLGTLQEYVALTTYNAIADMVTDEPAQNILRQIARQEGRHMRFYRRGAEAILADDRIAQRFVKFALNRYWRPPGIDLLGYEAWFETFAPLFGASHLRERYLRTDRLCAGLPGIGDLGIMRAFLSQYDQQRGAPMPTSELVSAPA